MADLVVTLQFNKTELSLPDVHRSIIIPGMAFDPAVSYVGKMVALDPTTMRWTLASAGATGTSIGTVVGLCTSQRGRNISIAKMTWVGNQQINLSPAVAGDRLFLSNTAGAIATAAGTSSLAIGRVIPATDGAYGPDNTPLLFLDIPWN